jgi:tRNA G18 (ribose-2'-O)-methylase SpoU
VTVIDRKEGASWTVAVRLEPSAAAQGRLDLDDVVYGVHAVEEALAAGEPLRRIYVGDERKRDPRCAR